MDEDNFDLIINGSSVEILPKILIDDVLVKEASHDQINDLLRIMTKNKLEDLSSITFLMDDLNEGKNHIKKKFQVIKAAGGVVEKGDQVLLIYRLKKWDLPKGKIEKKESIREGAIREVEEETRVQVDIIAKIGHSWHTYIRNDKYILKQTHWFRMACRDDSKMKPQISEDIERVVWMDINQAKEAFYNSYRSIRSVFKGYLKVMKE